MAKMTITIQILVCELCGKYVNAEDLKFRNIMNDHKMFRYDFCPSCGTRKHHIDSEWRAKVNGFMEIKKRAPRNRFT